ncbi:MAG: hypothetical protein ACSHYA_00040 [Opitutaceae bacterium]
MAKRLPHTQNPVGLHAKTSSTGLFLFGLPFIGIGIWIALIGLKVIEVDPKSVHAPYPLLTLIGAIFGMGGVMLWNMGFQHMLKLKRIAKQMQRHPNNPAMTDYIWNPNGYSPPRWKPIFSAWTGALLVSLFGVPLFWFAFGEEDSPWFLKGMSVFMGLILIWVYSYALKVTWHAIKYGKSTLIFNQFPMPIASTIQVEIKMPMSLHRANGATLTLRQIEEFYETTGSGKNRRKTLIQEAHYESTQELTPTDLAMWPRTIKAKFQLPENAPTTKLHAARPRYWHVELVLDNPGLDLKQQYLLPIY